LGEGQLKGALSRRPQAEQQASRRRSRAEAVTTPAAAITSA
jgi:hypothetical protein